MFNFKKSALASVLLTGMAISSGAQASSSATVIWSGTVPTTNASDAMVITGLSGDLTALNGTITPSSDGVFESDTIVLESHANDGTANAPVVGDLAVANWTLVDAAVTYDGTANPAQEVEVEVNGEVMAVGGSVESVESISTKVRQTAALPESEVGGTAVQATVTVMADLV